jgi:Thiol-activated cytolysin
MTKMLLGVVMSTRAQLPVWAVLLLAAVGVGGRLDAVPRDAEINNYVRDYLPLRSVPRTTSQVTKEGTDVAGDLIGRRRQYCKQNDYHGETTFGEIIALDSTVGLIWPGNLIQGRSLATGNLNEIKERRTPMKVTLSKVVKNDDGHREDKTVYSKIMQQPSFDEFQNRVLHDLVENPAEIQGTPSYQELLTEEIHTLEQAGMKLGLNISYLNNDISVALDHNSKRERSSLMVKFVQVYYSFSVESPQQPADVFGRGVRVDSEFRRQVLKSADPKQNNPALYIQSVDYGRVMVLSMSSSYSEQTMERAFRAAVSAWTVSANASLDEQTKEVIRNSWFDAYVIGGSSEAGGKLLSAAPGPEGPKAIAEWIEKGASYDPAKSPGAIISYKVRYLADREVAGAFYETDWTQNDCRSDPIPLQGVGINYFVGKDNSKHERMQATFHVYVDRGSGKQLWSQAVPGYHEKWEEKSEHPSAGGYYEGDQRASQINNVTLADCPAMTFEAGELDPTGQGNTTGWNTTLRIALKFENQWHVIKEFEQDGNEFLWGDASTLGSSHLSDTVRVKCPGSD